MNAAVPVDRGVVIRAGSGVGPLDHDCRFTTTAAESSPVVKPTARSAGLPDRLPVPPAPCPGRGWSARARHGHHQPHSDDCASGAGHDGAYAGIGIETRAAFPNRHLTEDEEGISAKFPEVKGDGAMAAAEAESKWAHVHRMIRPLNADDADRLGISSRATTEFACASSSSARAVVNSDSGPSSSSTNPLNSNSKRTHTRILTAPRR